MAQLKKRIEAPKVESKGRVQETSRGEILGGLRENMYLNGALPSHSQASEEWQLSLCPPTQE